MLRRRAGIGVLICLMSLFAARSAKADFFFFTPETPGQILINNAGGINDAATSSSAAEASAASNPVAYVPRVVAANWVFQFKLSDLIDLGDPNDISAVQFNVMMEGNTDPGLYFGVGHGAANGPIGVGTAMSPGTLTAHQSSTLVEPFILDVTSDVKAAIANGYEFYRFALSANPGAQSFTAASFYDPGLEVQTVPEPSTFACFGLGALAIGALKLRRRR